MGSELRLTAWTTDEAAARAAFDAVFAEFERLEGADEHVAAGQRRRAHQRRGRRRAGRGRTPTSATCCARRSRSASGPSGTFDVTFGALTDVWKFDHDQDNTVPVRGRDPRAAAADRLPPDRDRRSRRHGVPEAQGHEDPSRRHRQGLRRRARACRSCASAGLRDFMIQAGGDLYVGGHKDGRPWRLGIHDPRGPEGKTLRDDRSHRQHVQHVRRLRALLHQGRRPLSPHPRSCDRPAGAAVPQRDDRRRRARCSPTRSRKACSSSGRKRAWRWSRRFRIWKR